MMDFCTWGVDPGVKGAIVAVCFRGKGLDCVPVEMHFEPIPLVERHGKQRLDTATLVKIVQHWKNIGLEPARVVVETHSGQPGNRSNSLINQGVMIGSLCAAFEVLGFEVDEVFPQSWRRKFNIRGKKQEVVSFFHENRLDRLMDERARIRFERLAKDVRHGIIDAFFIACYASECREVLFDEGDDSGTS